MEICRELKHFSSTWPSVSSQSLCLGTTKKSLASRLALSEIFCLHYFHMIEMKATWSCHSWLHHSRAYLIQRCLKAECSKCRKNSKQTIRELNSKFKFDGASVSRWLIHKKTSLAAHMYGTLQSTHTPQRTLLRLAPLQQIAGSYPDLYLVSKLRQLRTRSSTSDATRRAHHSASQAARQRTRSRTCPMTAIKLIAIECIITPHFTQDWPFTQSTSITYAFRGNEPRTRSTYRSRT